MKWLEVRKSNPLRGSIKITGSKNSTLGLMAACCLSDETIVLDNVPNIEDVHIAGSICRDVGLQVEEENGSLAIYPSPGAMNTDIAHDKSSHFRAAYYFIGGLLAKKGRVSIGYPGGDSIGPRPIDQHIKGLRALGARITFHKDHYVVEADRLVGTDIYFDVISSGATINLMLAAVLAKGRTTLHNAARDPEVVDIAVFLNEMGARIYGAGTHTIRIIGVSELGGCRHSVIPDRLTAATFLMGAAVSGGCVTVTDVIPEHLEAFLQKLKEIGVDVKRSISSVRVTGHDGLVPAIVRTGMYPILGSDYQQLLTPLLLMADGVSLIQDRVFPERFQHCYQLNRMGAGITVCNGTATIPGKAALSGTWVQASDIRAGSCLILAGMMADGITRITGVGHLERGYEDIVGDFRNLGGDISVFE